MNERLGSYMYTLKEKAQKKREQNEGQAHKTIFLLHTHILLTHEPHLLDIHFPYD